MLVRYGALLSYTLYIAKCTLVRYTKKSNEYYLEADSETLRKSDSTQNIKPTPNGTNRSAAMISKQLGIISNDGQSLSYLLIRLLSVYSKFMLLVAPVGRH